MDIAHSFRIQPRFFPRKNRKTRITAQITQELIEAGMDPATILTIKRSDRPLKKQGHMIYFDLEGYV